MEKTKYKVGEMVRVKKHKVRPGYWNNEGKMDNMMGKVYPIHSVSSRQITNAYEIEYDGRIWTLREHDLEKANECIVIYRKDNQVIALDKSTGNKAIARCNSVDEFDFHTGAKIAFERLMHDKELEEKKLLNTKICITETHSGSDYLTVGKIYEIKDGRFKNDVLVEYPCSEPLNDIKDLELYLRSIPGDRNSTHQHYGPKPVRFVEIVE